MNPEVPAWLAPVATLAVGVISAAALVIVRRIRGPVTIQDLWGENRQLRKDLDAISRKVDALLLSRETQLNINRVMGEGFDAQSALIERTGTATFLTPQEQSAIDKARALRDDDDLWNTLQHNPTTQGATP
jgi:hypothetical protein